MDRLTEFERSLADDTREFADGVEAITGEHIESLFQAERSMLAAVDSLSAVKYDNAGLQERDALKYLIEARNKVMFAISKPQSNAAMRKFDRTQAQKLRKPKTKDEEAEQVAERLRQLAKQEDFVYATLASMMTLDGKPPQSPVKPSGQSGQAKAERTEKPSEQKPTEPQPNPGQSPQGQQGSQGQKGSQGEGAQGEQGSQRQEGSQGETGKEDKGSQGMDRHELEKLQQQIADEAHDLERIMKGIKDLTPLAQSRMGQATEDAEQAAGAMTRGNTKEATERTGTAAKMFDELAQHVEGMVSREVARRIAMARDLAGKLAENERKFSEAMPGGDRSETKSESGSQFQNSQQGEAAKGEQGSKGEGSKGEGEQGRTGGSEGPGSREDSSIAKRQSSIGRDGRLDHSRFVESGRTLEDWLKALAEMERSGNPEAIKQIRQIMEEGAVSVTVKRMERLGDVLVAGRWREAKFEARDISQRLEAVAQKLDVLHRTIVAPRLEELMAAEKRAAELQTKLDTLDSELKITEWHREANAFVGDIDKISGASNAGDGLLDAMRDAGWGNFAGGWHWAWHENHYGAPAGYYGAIHRIIEELQNQAQEILLSDLVASGDEAVPPEYKALVEQYYKVLSADVRKN